MFLSITNDTLIEAAKLGVPMRIGFAALQNYDLEWFSDHQPLSVDTVNRIFYNLYVAMLRFWRGTNDRPITQAIELSTNLYPDIVTSITPVSSRYIITPSLAAAVLWTMLGKCLETEPALWDLEVVTKVPPFENVGHFNADVSHRAISAANSSSLTSNISSIQSSSVLSAAPDGKSFTASNGYITTHVDFRGRIAHHDPRSIWLQTLISWSIAILIPADSTKAIRPNADGTICKIHSTPSLGVRLTMQSNLISHWSGRGPLTYGELLTGITMILESIVVTSQFDTIDAFIYKNSRRAANFRVTADYSASDHGSVSTA